MFKQIERQLYREIYKDKQIDRCLDRSNVIPALRNISQLFKSFRGVCMCRKYMDNRKIDKQLDRYLYIDKYVDIQIIIQIYR